MKNQYVKTANKQHLEPRNINIDEELPITLEKQFKGKVVIIGEENNTCVFYSDTVTSSIAEETVAKMSGMEYSADKCN